MTQVNPYTMTEVFSYSDMGKIPHEIFTLIRWQIMESYHIMDSHRNDRKEDIGYENTKTVYASGAEFRPEEKVHPVAFHQGTVADRLRIRSRQEGQCRL